MSLLPSLENIRKELGGGDEKPKFDWNALLINRCPSCNNYLEGKGKLLVCNSTRIHEYPFRIAVKKVMQLKEKIMKDEERRSRKAFFKDISA